MLAASSATCATAWRAVRRRSRARATPTTTRSRANRPRSRYVATMLFSLVISVALAGDPAAGKLLYDASCTACHGVTGDGKGPAAIALKPKPADFTAAAFWVSRTDDQVALSIRTGRPG